MTQTLTMIIGPTAIGKSKYAIELAQQQGAEIISADAFQVYRGLDIGTAKVLPPDQCGIPHHLIDIKRPDEQYSVQEFCSLTHSIIENTTKPLILCGGTGLYCRAFLYHYDFSQAPPRSSDIRADFESRLEKDGEQALWDHLYTLDPESADATPPQNTRRVIRALEIYTLTGQKASTLRTQSETPRSDVAVMGLSSPREILYERINQRVDHMITDGLVDEVRKLMTEYPDSSPAFQALGYKETIAYLNGSLCYEEMIELIKKKTRHFAKRQLTWYRQLKHVTWIDIN